MGEMEIESLRFEYLYELSEEELVQIAGEKGIPDPDTLDREELISAIELEVLAGIEEAERQTGEEERIEEGEEEE